MTDTATPAPAPTGGMVDLSQLQGIASTIAALDEKIAAATGNEASIRKSVLTQVETDNAERIQAIIDALLPQFGTLEPAVLVGVYNKLPQAMEEEYAGQIDEVVDSRVKALLDEVQGNVEPLKEKRKEQQNLFRAMAQLLEHLGVDVSSVPEPKRTAGRSSGGGSSNMTPAKAGYNADQYRYLKNGKAVGATQNQFSALIFHSSLGSSGTPEKPMRLSTAEGREFVANAGVKMGPPGQGDDTWEVELPNGTKIGGRRLDKELDKDIFDKLAAIDDNDEDEKSNGDASAPAPNAPEAVTTEVSQPVEPTAPQT